MKKLLLFLLLLPSILFAQWPYTGTPAASGSISGSSKVPIQDGGVSKTATPAQIVAAGGGGGSYTATQGINLNSTVFTLDTLKVPYYYNGRQAGYTYFNGTKWIAKNGTFAQFMMADGSFNSNTYVTTSVAAATYIPLTGTTELTGNILMTTDVDAGASFGLVNSSFSKAATVTALLGSGVRQLKLSIDDSISQTEVSLFGQPNPAINLNINTNQYFRLSGNTTPFISSNPIKYNTGFKSYLTSGTDRLLCLINKGYADTTYSFLVDSTLRKDGSGKLQSNLPPRNITGTTYTLTNADCGYFLNFTSASFVTVTLPSTGIRSNCNAFIYKGASTGNIRITAAGTLETVGSDTIVQPKSGATVYLRAPSIWFAQGALGTPSGGGSSGVTSITSSTGELTITPSTGAVVVTTNSAPKWTTPRLLAGNSVDGLANVPFTNKFIVQGTTDAGLTGAQFLGGLGTGIVKNTTSTGVLSIAVAADFPTLNQNTTGNAATVTTNANLTGDVTSVGNATTYNNVVPSTKGGAGTINGILKANGAGVVSAATTADLPYTINTLGTRFSQTYTSGTAAGNNLTKTGSGSATFASNTLTYTVTGGSFTFGESLYQNNYSSHLEKWSDTLKGKLRTLNTNTIGFSVGQAPVTGGGGNSSQFSVQINKTTGQVTFGVHTNASTTAAVSQIKNLNFAANDQFTFVLTCFKDQIFFNLNNTTQAKSVSWAVTSNYYQPQNAGGNFYLYNNGGDFDFTLNKVTSSELKGAKYIFVGDSKTGGPLAPLDARPADMLLQGKDVPYVVYARQSTRAVNFTSFDIAEINEIAQGQATIIVDLGVNDKASGTSDATIRTLINTLVTGITTGAGAGNVVFVDRITPCNTVVVTGINANILADYPNNNINLYDPFLLQGSTNIDPTFSGDGLHLNYIGIQNEVFIKRGALGLNNLKDRVPQDVPNPMFVDNNQAFRYYNNGFNTMTQLNSFVGINKAVPTRLLDIETPNTSTSLAHVWIKNTNTAGYTGVILERNDGKFLEITQVGSGVAGMGFLPIGTPYLNTNSGTLSFLSTTGDMRFGTNNTSGEAMRIDVSQNVMIGTTSVLSSNKLTVGGGIGATFNSSGSKNAFIGLNTNTNLGANFLLGQDATNKFVNIGYYGSGEATVGSLLANSGFINTGSTAVQLNLSTFGSQPIIFSTNNFTERARIDANGRLGLGTNAPTHTVTYASTSTGMANYNTVDQTTNYERARQYWSSNVYTIGTENGGTGVLRNINITGGNVGIGVAAPTATLHLKAGTTTAGTAPIKIPSGTNLTTTEDGAIERAGDVVTLTNSGLVRQELMQSQQARVATNFSSTSTTMADVTDLTRTLASGKTYRFRAVFYLSPNATGGFKLSVTGGVSSGSPVYLDQRLYFDNGASTVMLSERNTSLGNASTSTGSTSGMAVYEGTITPSVTGTLVFQFAQNVASGTSTILAGSNVVITQIQ